MRSFLIVIALIFALPLSAQSAYQGLKVDTVRVTIKKFDEAAISEYQSLQEFDYRQQTVEYEPSWVERVVSWLYRTLARFFEAIVGVENASAIMQFLVQALPYIIGLLFLYLIIKFFVERSTTDFISTAKNRKFNVGSEEEELIKNTDLDRLLKDAIAANNYREAVRYYYLIALKKLDAANIILWEQQKTNEDFIREITSFELKDAFTENTRLYDFVWYGDFSLTRDEFEQAEKDFKTTNTLIKNNK